MLQEGINGFHDTANAVTMVIYSNSLKPDQAIPVSIICIFLGVLLGGTAVAFSMVFLWPKEMVAGISTISEASLMLALVLTAVVWNLATWWYGISNSTTHTYVGSIIGVSIAHAVLMGTPVADAINWVEGEKIILTLFLSPVLGGVLAWLAYKGLKGLLKDPAMFEPHQEGVVPARGIRNSLIGGLVGVSFLHGTNDGQKSIGLMLMVLMGMMPGLYSIDPVKDRDNCQHAMQTIAHLEDIATTLKPHSVVAPHAHEIIEELQFIKQMATREFEEKPLTEEEKQKLKAARKSLTDLVEEVPFWLILLSSIMLGLGTGIGYKKSSQHWVQRWATSP